MRTILHHLDQFDLKLRLINGNFRWYRFSLSMKDVNRHPRHVFDLTADETPNTQNCISRKFIRGMIVIVPTTLKM